MKKRSLRRKTLLFLGLTVVFSAIVKHSQDLEYDLNFVSNYNRDKDLTGSKADICFETSPCIEDNSAVINECDYPPKEKFFFLVNKKTNKYHKKQCPAVGKLIGEKRLEVEIEATSHEEAEEILKLKGYTICGLCKRM